MQRVKDRDKFITYITLFCYDRGYYLHFVDIIRILWISTFRGYYLHFVDIMCIGHITSSLACNSFHIFHIYSYILSE